jgi:adenylosuccinate lyase
MPLTAELETSIMQHARSDGRYAIAAAIIYLGDVLENMRSNVDGLAVSADHIARELKNLGDGNVLSEDGAMANLANRVQSLADKVNDGLDHVAESLEKLIR